MKKLRPETSALLEIGLLFLPSIPALIWLWPSLEGARLNDLVQSLVYVYFFCGVVVIGRRRWSWDQLGLNRGGIILSLACGSVLVVERLLANIILGLPLALRPFDPSRLAWEVFFYFALVAFVEELLFRGLLFRVLENRRGAALAVIGSALGFAVWHIGWAGPFIVAHFLIGLLLGLIRWRAGSIPGLIIIHGLFDLLSVEMQTLPGISSLDQLLHLRVVQPAAGIVGDILMLAVLIYLLWGYPRLQAAKSRLKS